MIARHIAWNAFGGIFALILGVLVVPFQANFLGTSAYGIVGFILSLQVAINLLDLGMSTTALRAIADPEQPSGATFSTIMGIAWTMAGLASFAIVSASAWLVNVWIGSSEALRDDASFAIAIAGIAFALRIPAACQAGALAGAQRIDLVNILRAVGLLVRHGGSLVVLAYRPDLPAFAIWMLVSSIIEILLNVAVLSRVQPNLPHFPTISRTVLPWIGRTGFGLSLITLQGLVLTQSDRWIIAKLGTLEDLGRYSIAYQIVLSMGVVQSFVVAAMLPYFARDPDGSERAKRIAMGSEVLAITLAPCAAVLCFFADTFVKVIMPGSYNADVMASMAFLALGFLGNSGIALLMAESMAVGRITRLVIMNFLLMPFYILGSIWAVKTHGPYGAALMWMLLNAVYIAVVPFLCADPGQRLQRYMLVYRRFSPAWASAFIVFSLGSLLSGWMPIVAILGLCGLVYAGIAWRMADPQLRQAFVRIFTKVA